MELKGEGGTLWSGDVKIGDVLSWEVREEEQRPAFEPFRTLAREALAEYEKEHPRKTYKPNQAGSGWRRYLESLRAGIRSRRRLGEANGVAH
jgi:hypothetical protein